MSVNIPVNTEMVNASFSGTMSLKGHQNCKSLDICSNFGDFSCVPFEETGRQKKATCT